MRTDEQIRADLGDRLGTANVNWIMQTTVEPLRAENTRLRAALDSVRLVRNSVEAVYPVSGRPVRLANVVDAIDRALAAAAVGDTPDTAPTTEPG
jgi:hypothetical protein